MSQVRKNHATRTGKTWKPLLLPGLAVLIVWWLYSPMQQNARREAFVAVDLGGKQHIGPDFNIAEFYLNGTNGFNVGREGGGGRDVCCVFLPRQWRPGLSVDLRWSVGDWTQVNPSDANRKHRIPAFASYRARVPLERYAAPGRVVVHFFAGGKARVIAGWPEPDGMQHAILPANSRAADAATAGSPVDGVFSKEEIEAMHRREDARKNSFFGGGGWK